MSISYIIPFPEKYGGGIVKIRELPLDVEKRIRQAHAKDEESSALGDDLVMSCITAVSVDIADAAGITSAPPDTDHPHLPTVNDQPPGRREVWKALGIHRRRLVDLAWVKTHSVDDADVAPFLDSIQTVV